MQAVDRGDSYSWQGPSTWACYRPDADILVPVFSPYGHNTILSPYAAERNISLLMRFDYPLTDGKSLVAHHGHRLRKELIDYWAEQPLNGSDLGLRSTKASAAWESSATTSRRETCSNFCREQVLCSGQLAGDKDAFTRTPGDLLTCPSHVASVSTSQVPGDWNVYHIQRQCSA